METLFSDSILNDTLSLSLSNTLTVVLSALALGFLISLVYIQTHKHEGYSGNFAVTMIMLPAIIAMIILLVGSNLARAFSLAGAFSLIRFRSAPGDPKDIAYVFFTLGVGLACGMGYILYAAAFAMILCIIMVVLSVTKYARNTDSDMSLKITVPEDINYKGLFDDVLKKYTHNYRLHRIKTTDFGNLFEVSYYVKLRESASDKEFLDELRCLNRNLNIALVLREF